MFEHLVPGGGAVWVGCLGDVWLCQRKYVTVGGGFELQKSFSLFVLEVQVVSTELPVALLHHHGL